MRTRCFRNRTLLEQSAAHLRRAVAEQQKFIGEIQRRKESEQRSLRDRDRQVEEFRSAAVVDLQSTDGFPALVARSLQFSLFCHAAAHEAVQQKYDQLEAIRRTNKALQKANQQLKRLSRRKHYVRTNLAVQRAIRTLAGETAAIEERIAFTAFGGSGE